MIKNFLNKLFNKPKPYISFKQGLDLTDLPICTFYQGENKLNFLLDTGSSSNLLDSRIKNNCQIIKYLNDKATLTGVGGTIHPVTSCIMDIEYNGEKYSDIYVISDVSAPFDAIKKSYGVKVHGILGNKFFQKYKYVLDFNELIAYSKK